MRSETTSRHFEWNHSDQMKAFRTQTDGAEPTVHAHYLYDAAGQRVKKLVRKQGGQIEVTHYIDAVFEHHRWDGQAQAGENNHVHVMDDKQRIALVRLGTAHPNDRGPAVQFHFGDHLGSSNVVTDSAGALVNREEFTPYGETSFGSFAKKRYRFTGMERDEETGFNYHGARYYAPWLGRWTKCDPAGFVDGTNLYRYVANPVKLTDPSGTGPMDPAIYGEEKTKAEEKDKRDNIVATLVKVHEKFRAHYEAKIAVQLVEAHTNFRVRHNDHDKKVLDNIDTALQKVTRNNPNLLVAYYKYYAHHKLTDETPEKDAIGDTNYGDTKINPHVLALEERKKDVKDTDDFVSLLGSNLLHEFVHTSQGGGHNAMARWPLEAKAYGIESFFAERMGDKTRKDFATQKGSDYDQKIFNESQRTIRALYEVIDRGNHKDAEQARQLSVEFISRTDKDYSPELNAFRSKLFR